ncbi:MAG TPA: FAD-dependent oxidoreductase, partial [Kineosporiaceae bacterium]
DVEIVTRSVTDPRSVDAPVVVIAAGCASAAIAGQPVRPVKGQVLRLRAGDRHPVLRGTVRGWADGRSVYLVPRADGDLIVGATAEERRDRTATAGAVLDLLRAATDLVPAVSEYELVEVSVGHRPATPDNAPLIGPLASGPGKRLIAATGHYRNGILLAPVTADAVAELVVTGETPEVIAAFGVDRRPWTPVHGHAEDAGTHPGSSAWT